MTIDITDYYLLVLIEVYNVLLILNLKKSLNLLSKVLIRILFSSVINALLMGIEGCILEQLFLSLQGLFDSISNPLSYSPMPI